MGKALTSIVITAGLAMAFAGSMGTVAHLGKMEDNCSPEAERVCILDDALENHSSRDEGLSERIKERYTAMETELRRLKFDKVLAPSIKLYIDAKERRNDYLTLMFAGYVICIAGAFKERTEEIKHKP